VFFLSQDLPRSVVFVFVFRDRNGSWELKKEKIGNREEVSVKESQDQVCGLVLLLLQ
jgi:hypothetical protein